MKNIDGIDIERFFQVGFYDAEGVWFVVAQLNSEPASLDCATGPFGSLIGRDEPQGDEPSYGEVSLNVEEAHFIFENSSRPWQSLI